MVTSTVSRSSRGVAVTCTSSPRRILPARAASELRTTSSKGLPVSVRWPWTWNSVSSMSSRTMPYSTSGKLGAMAVDMELGQLHEFADDAVQHVGLRIGQLQTQVAPLLVDEIVGDGELLIVLCHLRGPGRQARPVDAVGGPQQDRGGQAIGEDVRLQTDLLHGDREVRPEVEGVRQIHCLPVPGAGMGIVVDQVGCGQIDVRIDEQRGVV